MNKLLTILGVGIVGLSLADSPRIIDFSYNSSTKKARITSVTPTNELWRVQYKEDLTSTNDWRSYANVLRGSTNVTDVYSPTPRYFRLKKE